MDLTKEKAEYLKNLRKKTGLSQKQFASKFDIPIYTLQQWEQGRRVPKKYVLKMMEEILRLEKRTDTEKEEREN